jgi:hypothetical protein
MSDVGEIIASSGCAKVSTWPWSHAVYSYAWLERQGCR